MARSARDTSGTARRDLLEAAQQRAVVSGRLDAGLDAELRAVVRDSWTRSLASAIDPDSALPRLYGDEGEFLLYRDRHELAGVMPVIRRLLTAGTEDAGLVVAVGDQAGRLLWVEGDDELRRRAEAMLFVAGADWSEQSVGTSAPGTALALDAPVQIRGAEHFTRLAHSWSCTAAPVHDPVTGVLVGMIDITGGDIAVAPHTLSLVSATVAAVEAELRIQSLQTEVSATLRRARVHPVQEERTPLRILGSAKPTLGGRGLSLRHAELLTMLAWHPRGLSGEQLSDLVFGETASPVTVRAEMTRLRRALVTAGEPPLESHPYRLARGVSTDARTVLDLLNRGSHRRALDLYVGAVLPESSAPGIVALRGEVGGRLREAMLTDASPEVLLRYAETDDASYDVEVWRTLLRVLPARSPRRASVVAHLEWIELELA